MGDEYVDRFKDIKLKGKASREGKSRQERRVEFRQGYHKRKKGDRSEWIDPPGYVNDRTYADSFLNSVKGNESSELYGASDKGELLRIAKNFTAADKSPLHGDVIVTGAKIYEALGLAGRNSVKRRILNAYDSYVENGGSDKEITGEIDSFLKRNSGFRGILKSLRHRNRTLDDWLSADSRKLSTLILSLAGLLGIFFLSSNLTGNVVGNLSIGSSNAIGGILLFLAVLGFAYFLRNR